MISFSPRFFAMALFLLLSACGGARGKDCTSDKDCDSITSCISPGCASTAKKCAVLCATDAECKTKTGNTERCVKPNPDCAAYCTP
jgi:hypothetical protein